MESLRQQTIFDRSQIIFADNQSKDGSDVQGRDIVSRWPNGLFIQNACNPGFGGGVNLAVRQATGRYLFFLNPDVWLEPACLEEMYRAAEQVRAGAVGLLVLDYENDEIQSRGGTGFDLTGHGVEPRPGQVPDTLFMAHGFCFIRKDLFEKVGGYDEAFFLYGEELEICWKVWAAGETIVHAPLARIHHRGAATENPAGGTKLVELRTSESKRFYANRNQILGFLNNAQHVLLLLLIPCLFLYFVESMGGALLARRWSVFKRTFLDPVASCWSLRGHILGRRRAMRRIRVRGDFWMLRFLSWRIGRIQEYRKILRLGLPKIDAR